MGIHKVYICDLCAQPMQRSELTRLGVRGLDERPEDADNVDVGPCCKDRPVGIVLAHAAAARELAVTGG